MGSTGMSYCRMCDVMDSTSMSYCRMCDVICNNGDGSPKTSHIRSTLHHMAWQLCTKRWKQVSDFGPFSCISQITTGGTNAHKPATAPDESFRTLPPLFFTVHFNITSSVSTFNFKMRKTRKQVPWKSIRRMSVCQDRTPITTWNSEDRASWYNLIIKANKMHYSQLYFGKELYMFRTDLLSIISSPNTVFTGIGICHIRYVNTLLASSEWNSVSSWPR
jgi:hypothetical protein